MADEHELDDLNPFDLLDLESARLDMFMSSLPEDAWYGPTRCAGWTVRDLLAHLSGIEEYNHACLDDGVEELLGRAQATGVADMDAFNAWGVDLRRRVPTRDLLKRWRDDNAAWRRHLRMRGRDGRLTTADGWYPVGLYTFYMASEYATHADDIRAPVGSDERADRTAWRYRFTRYALEENERPVRIESRGGANLVVVGERQVVLTDEDVVEGAVGRLRGEIPDRVLAALVCLA